MMKKQIAFFLVLATVMTMAGCGGAAAQPSSTAPSSVPNSASSVPQPAPAAGVTFTDALGNTVTVENPKKVVSLYGSFAEMWVLAGGTLVGTTDDAVSERKLELGQDVKIIGSVKAPNLEEILALEPDFVLLSADISEDVKAAQTLQKAGVPYAFFRVDYLEDYLAAMKICTDITGRTDLYEKNALEVKAQVQKVIGAVQGQKAPKTLLIRAFSTGAKAKGADNQAGAILKELGAVNIADASPSLLEDLSMEKIIAEDPDFIFVITMGSSSQKALDALKAGIQANPAWAQLSAVKNNRYIILPRELFHFKPNVRWGESYEYMAKILYPGVLGEDAGKK